MIYKSQQDITKFENERKKVDPLVPTAIGIELPPTVEESLTLVRGSYHFLVHSINLS